MVERGRHRESLVHRQVRHSFEKRSGHGIAGLVVQRRNLEERLGLGMTVGRVEIHQLLEAHIGLVAGHIVATGRTAAVVGSPVVVDIPIADRRELGFRSQTQMEQASRTDGLAGIGCTGQTLWVILEVAEKILLLL